MEGERLSKAQSKCHLPEELCREVLLRLPVKSVLRFRSVSKSWLSLTRDPEFCRLHLQNFKNNRDETHLLVVQGRPPLCYDVVVRCSDTFKISAFLTLPPRCREGVWSIRCYFDGLVLLKGPGWNNLVVWNPSIRKYHDIPPSPVNETHRNSPFADADLGLGYDLLAKDYKYVKLIFAGLGSLQSLESVEVYTLGDRSWKTIQFQGKKSSDWHWWLIRRFPKTVYMQGSIYFTCRKIKSGDLELVSFDLSREKFDSISWPPALTGPPNWEELYFLLPYGRSSLALVDLGFEDYIKWAVLENASESMSWTKSCCEDKTVSVVLFLKKNLDLLLEHCGEEMSFSLSTNNSFVERFSVVSSYNLETKEEKIVFVEKQESHVQFDGVYGYIESLVLLN